MVDNDHVSGWWESKDENVGREKPLLFLLLGVIYGQTHDAGIHSRRDQVMLETWLKAPGWIE